MFSFRQARVIALAGMIGIQVPVSAPSSSTATDSSSALARRSNAYLSLVTQWAFSGAIVIESRGRLPLAAGYGWQDSLATDPDSAKTRFDLGPLARQCTATAPLLLVEPDRLNLRLPFRRAAGATCGRASGAATLELSAGGQRWVVKEWASREPH